MGLFKRQSKDLFVVPGTDLPAVPAVPVEPVAGSGFRLVVVDVFVITGRGTVVTGRVEAGVATIGTRVTVERPGRGPLTAEIAGIDLVRRTTRQARSGENVGLLFRELSRGEIVAGDVIRT